MPQWYGNAWALEKNFLTIDQVILQMEENDQGIHHLRCATPEIKGERGQGVHQV